MGEDLENHAEDALVDDGRHGWNFDQEGNVWRLVKDHVIKFEPNGINEYGVPLFGSGLKEDGGCNTVYDMPTVDGFTEQSRRFYDAKTDSMYIMGFNEEYPKGSDGHGRVLYRFDNWSTDPVVHENYPIVMPYFIAEGDSFGTQASHIMITSFTVEDERLFLLFGTRCALGYKGGEIDVYDSDTAELLGYVAPGPEIGGDNVGWVDVPDGITALKVAGDASTTGEDEWLLLVEEDWKGKQILYRVTPYNGIPVVDEPDEVEIPTVTARQVANGTITVDGKLDEEIWQKMQGTLDKQTGSALTDSKVSFATAWDSSYLYVAVDVIDTTPFATQYPDVPWENDAVEYFFDGNNDKGGGYDSNDAQYVYAMNPDYDDFFCNVNSKASGVLHAFTRSGDHYYVELAVPWKHLGGVAEIGREVGFDVAYDDDMKGGSREGSLVWSGDGSNFQSNSKFGMIILGDETIPDDEDDTYNYAVRCCKDV